MVTELLIALSPFGAFVSWAALQVAAPTLKKKISLAYHRRTEGRKLADHDTMVMVLESLKQFPDDWKIGETSAQFPKQGAYKIAVQRDHRNGSNNVMQVSLAGDETDGRYRNVSPYFEEEIQKILNGVANEQKRKIVERTLFPDGMPLMLGHG